MSFPEWQHKFTATRPLPLDDSFPGNIKARRITVTAGLRYLQGNPLPYFSVTASTELQSRSGRWLEDMSGPMSDLVLAAFPELAPVAALHCADRNGDPMHAVSNALYWAGLSDFPDAKDTGKMARHLRTSVEEAESIVAYCLSDGTQHYSAAMDFCLKGLRSQWRQEAADAIATLDRLIAEQED